MGGNAGLFGAIGGIDLIADQKRNHGAAGRPGIHRDIKAITLKKTAFFCDVELREGRIYAGGDGDLVQKILADMNIPSGGGARPIPPAMPTITPMQHQQMTTKPYKRP
jgi:hypothetical protein